LVSLILLITSSNTAYAEGYWAIGGGYGGEAETGNLSLELGKINRKTGQIFGFGVGFIFNADSFPSDTIETPIPHNNFTDLGVKQKGNEYALYGKYGKEIVNKSGWFFYGLGGASFSEDVRLVRSNVTGWFWEQSSKSVVNFLYGAGIAFMPTKNQFILQIEYDNRRGGVGLIGTRF